MLIQADAAAAARAVQIGRIVRAVDADAAWLPVLGGQADPELSVWIVGIFGCNFHLVGAEVSRVGRLVADHVGTGQIGVVTPGADREATRVTTFQHQGQFVLRQVDHGRERSANHFQLLTRLEVLRVTNAVDSYQQLPRNVVSLRDLFDRLAETDRVFRFQQVLPGEDHRAGQLIEQIDDLPVHFHGDVRAAVQGAQRQMGLVQPACVQLRLDGLHEVGVLVTVLTLRRLR